MGDRASHTGFAGNLVRLLTGTPRGTPGTPRGRDHANPAHRAAHPAHRDTGQPGQRRTGTSGYRSTRRPDGGMPGVTTISPAILLLSRTLEYLRFSSLLRRFLWRVAAQV